MKDSDVGSKVVSARDSGWGDDYYYYLECDAHSGLAGARTELRLSDFPRSRWHCEQCHYGLDEPARPDAPQDLA